MKRKERRAFWRGVWNVYRVQQGTRAERRNAWREAWRTRPELRA